MAKNQFRILVIFSLITGILAGLHDYFWTDPILDKINTYIAEIVDKEWENDLSFLASSP